MKKKYVLTLACLCCMLLSQAQTLSKARELFNAGNYEEALPTFRKLVKQSPSNANYNYWYGVCCMETGADSIAGPYLTKAASRKVLDAYPYLTRLQMNTYKFDDAVSTCEDYIDLLTTRKKDTQEAEKLLEKARMGALMLRGTERVCVVDSFVVDKADFLSAYKTGPESGQTTMPDDSTFYYENELGQKRYWALTQSGRTDIYTSDKLLDKWSTPKPVKGLDTDGNNNYPYLLADGTTLAFTGVKSMTATAYTAGHGGADYTTATGTFVRVGTVAVDKSVIPLGTRMYIVTNDGSVVYGLAVAEDTGVRGNIVDLYYDTYQQCINFGRRTCNVYILK